MVSPVKRARGLRPRATRNAPGTIRTCDLCLRSGPSERAEIANVPPVVLAEVKVDVCPPEVRHRCADLTGEFLDLNLVLAVLLKPISWRCTSDGTYDVIEPRPRWIFTQFLKGASVHACSL